MDETSADNKGGMINIIWTIGTTIGWIYLLKLLKGKILGNPSLKEVNDNEEEIRNTEEIHMTKENKHVDQSNDRSIDTLLSTDMTPNLSCKQCQHYQQLTSHLKIKCDNLTERCLELKNQLSDERDRSLLTDDLLKCEKKIKDDLIAVNNKLLNESLKLTMIHDNDNPMRKDASEDANKPVCKNVYNPVGEDINEKTSEDRKQREKMVTHRTTDFNGNRITSSESSMSYSSSQKISRTEKRVFTLDSQVTSRQKEIVPPSAKTIRTEENRDEKCTKLVNEYTSLKPGDMPLEELQSDTSDEEIDEPMNENNSHTTLRREKVTYRQQSSVIDSELELNADIIGAILSKNMVDDISISGLVMDNTSSADVELSDDSLEDELEDEIENSSESDKNRIVEESIGDTKKTKLFWESVAETEMESNSSSLIYTSHKSSTSQSPLTSGCRSSASSATEDSLDQPDQSDVNLQKQSNPQCIDLTTNQSPLTSECRSRTSSATEDSLDQPDQSGENLQKQSNPQCIDLPAGSAIILNPAESSFDLHNHSSLPSDRMDQENTTISDLDVAGDQSKNVEISENGDQIVHEDFTENDVDINYDQVNENDNKELQ